jgi:hypothetical protein
MATKKERNKKRALLFGLGGAVVLGYFLLRKPDEQTPALGGSGRGLNNNNPLNIIMSPINWIGEIPAANNTDGKFEQFDTMENGYLATLKNLRTYISHGYNNLDKIIPRWANGGTQPAPNYINFVSNHSGIASGQNLNLVNSPKGKADWWKIIEGMGIFENGSSESARMANTEGAFNDAWQLLWQG